MSHPAITAASLARLRAVTTAATAEPAPGRPAKGAAARQRAVRVAASIGRPVVARIREQVLAEVRPEIDAAKEEAARLRAELARARTDLGAEIEILRAELAGRPAADPQGPD
ncbi:MAG: hypothetical protein HYX34_05925 [Actinobacteria bacterium]|nr:hypothetical protein [Actinomycetota bacterium]